MNQNIDVSPEQGGWKTFVSPQNAPADGGAVKGREEPVQEARQRACSRARSSASISLVECALILRNGSQMIVQFGYVHCNRRGRQGSGDAMRLVAWNAADSALSCVWLRSKFLVMPTSIDISDQQR